MILKLAKKVLLMLDLMFGLLSAKLQDVRMGMANKFYGPLIVDNFNGGIIEIGARNVFVSKSRYTALGVAKPCILRLLDDNAIISVGNDNGFSGVVICAAISVKIGNGCLFGSGVTISDTDFHSLGLNNRRYNKEWSQIKRSPVNICDGVFIGSGAIILKGVNLGKNVVIGAGSVVTKSVPDNCVAAGNPAKIIKQI